MPSLTPPSQPPASADCQSTTQWAEGGAPQQTPLQMLRAGDGKMRVDTGNTSLITNPKEQQAILLDHVSKEAHIIPMPSAPTAPPAPPLGKGAAPSFQPPAVPPMNVEDLGKSVIEGQEVDGKRYVIQSPALPAAPPLPQTPQKPQVPGLPTTVETWTSTKLGLPVLTKVTGPFGQQICSCKTAATGEPHPAQFQIPAGYKAVIQPPSPPHA